MKPHKYAWLLLFLAPVAMGACGDAANRPPDRSLEGTYSSTVFAVETRDTVFNQLTGRTAISLTLNSDGTTTGSFAIAELQADLAGQWDATADTVHLHMASPSFLTRMPFVTAPDQLVGELHLQDGTLRLTLTKGAGSSSGAR